MLGYLLKQTIVPLIYLLFGTVIALGILLIGNNLIWFKVVLLFLNLALYVFIVGSISFKDGETAYKVLMANDLERWNIIRTGEDRPLKIKQEYALWKGFMPGLLSCIPLVLAFILHFIVDKGNNTPALAFSNVLYLSFGAFANVVQGQENVILAFYLNLTALAFLPLATGCSYYLGARKIRVQQEMIAEKKRQIYGDSANR